MKVELLHLTRVFQRGFKAVDDLSFSFTSGEVVGFVGPNGAGKTTTMRMLATLDVPDSGDILIDGKSILDDPSLAHRAVGFMPDDLPNRSDTTVDEYLDFFGRAYGLRGKELADAINGVEDFTGLVSFRDKTLRELSKGMKQRVSLARALVHDPQVIVMDEPANGLDPRARIELRELVRALAEQGKAILISSHILSELEEMCTTSVIIERGRRLSTDFEDDTAWIRLRFAQKEGEDFLARQTNFRHEIESIMNAYIKPDYSDYEKCLALYDYMVSNYSYDYDNSVDAGEDGSFCATLRYKKGICVDFSAMYAYLLMQCGVDAISVSNDGENSPGYHSWTFVAMDGKGYHIDPTWGLKTDPSDAAFLLDYFMMTDDDRAASGYAADTLEIYLLHVFYAKDYDKYDFTADDSRYRLPDGSYCTRYDTDRKVLYYTNNTIDDKEQTFRYE